MKRHPAAAIALLAALALFGSGFGTNIQGNGVTDTVQVIVGFKPHLNASAALRLQLPENEPELENDIDAIRGLGLELRPLFSRDAADISAERRTAPSADYPNLNRWARVTVDSEAEAHEAIELLRQLPSVDTAYIRPPVYPAAIFTDVQPAATPKFVRQQKYLKNPPDGLGAKWAWRKKKIKGSGVTVADVEGDWNAAHHDLKSVKDANIDGVRVGTALWYDHGTAEVGLVAGTRNNFGVTGIAFKADILMFSIFRKDGEGETFENIADAIDRAAAALEPGDIMFLPIEFRDTFTGGRGFAVEYFDDVFDAVKAAVAKGIIVVQAAGNGGLNLDSNIFEDKFNRDVRGDSGAIMVGAGGVPDSSNLRRLSFSNFGSRVDVQNWGTLVVSAGYGDLYSKGANREYTASFNGTSSASGLTAGVCALLQNYAKKTLNRPLTPEEMRDILVKTGTPQLPEGATQNIGPRPNLRKAFSEVDKLK